jgi:hypothetical protein
LQMAHIILDPLLIWHWSFDRQEILDSSGWTDNGMVIVNSIVRIFNCTKPYSWLFTVTFHVTSRNLQLFLLEKNCYCVILSSLIYYQLFIHKLKNISTKFMN